MNHQNDGLTVGELVITIAIFLVGITLWKAFMPAGNENQKQSETLEILSIKSKIS